MVLCNRWTAALRLAGGLAFEPAHGLAEVVVAGHAAWKQLSARRRGRRSLAKSVRQPRRSVRVLLQLVGP